MRIEYELIFCNLFPKIKNKFAVFKGFFVYFGYGIWNSNERVRRASQNIETDITTNDKIAIIMNE